MVHATPKDDDDVAGQHAASLILIVDDNPVNLQLLSELLEIEGYDVASASDGEMALERVRYEPPDLILLDALMPVLDGFEVCRRLKENPATRHIPVIFLTALASADQKLRGLRLGAADYLVKPFQEEEVLLRVKNHLALVVATRALREKNDELTRQMHELSRAEAQHAELTLSLERSAAALLEAKEQIERELGERVRAEEDRARLSEEIIALQTRRLRELAAPIIPITDWLVVVPLIGEIDEVRAEQAQESLLASVSEHGTEVVILDITGVPTIDADVALGFIEGARALRLVGASAMITGVSPEVARALVGIEVDMSRIPTFGTLQRGIAHAMAARQAAKANRGARRQDRHEGR
ncbi:response regulator [Chondromyces apiculatus]|uniref:Response regulator n=1 Tax=Chondromyces apiculatus DSM 436 TaxID=1192034 RepID=A0A017TH65_9BACT|nr:response regulator [Chondromyces apiculatus]EYF08559.1 response regulator [Chondromyces apiculatus DSM 436]